MKVSGLKEIRQRRGWTQLELAKRCGVSRGTISNFENDTKDARPSTAKKLAAALGVELEELTNPPIDWRARYLEEHARGLYVLVETLELLEGLLDGLDDLPPEDQRHRIDHIRRAVGILNEGLRDSAESAREAHRVETSRIESGNAKEEDAPAKTASKTTPKRDRERTTA